MDSLIAIAAAMLYVLAIATIIPGLSQQSGIKAKQCLPVLPVRLFFMRGFLSDLIFDGSGQNLSILNVASLISFIISLVMSIAMLKTDCGFIACRL